MNERRYGECESAILPVVATQVATRTRVYLFLLALTLPMDAFKPTAMLLREAGAKPAIPLMMAGAAWIYWRHWPELFFSCPKLWRTILVLCIAVSCVGTLAYVVNLGLDISYWDGVRSPPAQFVSQGALFVLVAPVLIAHAWLFSSKEVPGVLLRYIPTAALIHLLAIFAEWIGILRATSFPLSLFRGSFVWYGSKPSGFMTEPSYVGVFAATYGLLLLLCMPTKRRKDRVIGISIMLVALAIGGKTLVPVLFAGAFAYAYQVRAKLLNWKGLVVCVGLAAVTLYTILSYSVLNLQVNLSSAMRFGSTLLALNAASAGYGLLGVGFGQFNFMFLPRFAPRFLLYVPEAQFYFSQTLGSRASTYNLPARFLIEEGLLGLILFFSLVRITFRNGRAHNDLWHRFGAVLAGASLGFLLTQDTYFYPPFVCGAAILASRAVRA